MKYPKYVFAKDYSALSGKGMTFYAVDYPNDVNAIACCAIEAAHIGHDDKDVYCVVLYKRVGRSDKNCYNTIFRYHTKFDGVQTEFKEDYEKNQPIYMKN